MLLRCTDTGAGLVLLRPEGVWGFPGGHHEAYDRDLYETARREMYEETQIHRSACKRRSGRNTVELFFYPDLVVVGEPQAEEPLLRYVVFVLWVEREWRPVLNEEHQAASWLTLPQMAALPEMHPGVYVTAKELLR